MTLGRQYLQIPGPSNIPERISRAMMQPLVNHRGPEFAALQADCISGMKQVFQTTNDVVLLPSSGTGGLESSIVNTLSPGDKVLSVVQGVFSDRYASIAKSYGCDVTRIELEWGQAVDANQVEDALKHDASIKAVLLSHNETSTGVLNDVKSVGEAIHRLGHQALLMVDSISGLALADLKVDEWHIDVAISGSQKGLMLPPGMAFVAIGQRAWDAYAKSSMPRAYWDWKPIKATAAQGRTPYTPATSIMFGLREALAMLNEEGLDNIFQRHRVMSRAVREGVRALGMTTLPVEADASPSVSAINQPEGIDQKAMSKMLREKYNVVIGGGLQKLEGKIYRIGHMGQIYEPEILAIMGSLELVLAKLGAKATLGAGVTACLQEFASRA